MLPSLCLCLPPKLLDLGQLARVAVRLNEWDINQVLAEEPRLQFVPAQNLADDQIVCSVIAQSRRAMRVVSATSGAMARLIPLRN